MQTEKEMYSGENRFALVTGASSGIGEAFAIALAERGMSLILTARRRERLEKLKLDLESRFKVHCEILTADLAVRSETFLLMQRVEDFLVQKKATLSLLINNAGFGWHGFYEKMPVDQIEAMLEVNAVAPSLLMHRFLPAMQKRNFGQVINVASTAAFVPGPTMAMYFASKAYLKQLSQSVFYEQAGSQVQILTLCPGPTHSEFMLEDTVQRSKLFLNAGKLPSSYAVAVFALRGLKQKKSLAVHGLKNRLLVIFAGWVPIAVTAAVSKYFIGFRRRKNIQR